LIDKLLALGDRHRSIQAEVAIPKEVISEQQSTIDFDPLLASKELLKNIQRLGVIANQHYLVVGFRPDEM
jgi:hypothetical protein